MLWIDKSEPPSEFRNSVPAALADARLGTAPSGKTPFELLPPSAKQKLKESLLKEQGYLCAYCMRGIDAATMRVEHWHPQSDGETGARLSVQYSNMLACCPGGEETGAAPKDQTCDKRKGDRFITVNPTSRSDIDTLFYQRDGVIKSTNHAIQHDLGEPDETGDGGTLSPLGLNNKQLIRNRLAVWGPISSKLRHIHGKYEKIRFCRSMLKRYVGPDKESDSKGSGHRKPYAGIVVFFLTKELRSYGESV